MAKHLNDVKTDSDAVTTQTQCETPFKGPNNTRLTLSDAAALKEKVKKGE